MMDFLSKFIRSKQAHRSEKVKSVDEPNTSLKNQLSISVTEVENKKVNGEETSKENHSPRSLSSLAADKSRLLGTPQQVENTTTSTPKLAKKQEPSEFDPDISIEISPKYKRALLEQSVKETSLSLLTFGLEKLGIAGSDGEKSNFTLSDDDEAFQECQSSLSDLSGIKTKEDEKNDTLEAEIPSPNSSNKTLVLESNVTFDKVLQNATFDGPAVTDFKDDKEEKIVKNDNTFNFAEDDGGFSDVPVGLEESGVVSPANDATVVIEGEIENHTIGDSHEEVIAPPEIREQIESQSEIQPEAVNDPKPSETVDNPRPQIQSEIAFNPQTEVQQQCAASPEPEFVPSEPVNLNKTVDVAVEKPSEKSFVIDKTFPEVEIFTTNKTETSELFPNKIVSSQEHEISQEALETPLPDSPPSEVAEVNDVTMEDISEDREGIVSNFPAAQETTNEIKYRNIDESSKFDKTQTIPEPSKIFTEELKNSFDVQFKMPPPVAKFNEVQQSMPVREEEFGCGTSFNFADSDFDYLNNIGSEAVRNSLLNRDSVLLKFDPLLSRPVAVNKRLSDTKEEVDDFVADFALKIPVVKEEFEESYDSNKSRESQKEHEMSAEIMKDYNIAAENKSQEESFISGKEESTKASLHNNSAEYLEKMAELENKLKKEADVREEQLLKRISEKDKQIAKMNGVVEAYEKAISELIAEKEQLVQSYERKCIDLKSDSELNANHLASLEATFSDLHAKYERAKHVALELNDREKVLVQERQDLKESLKMQESRYEKMKSHAMAQLEIANTTLADLSRNHSAEVTKLKAQLKKEEISRASVNEQLIQKSKENAELVKICDELINGTQS